MSAKTFDVWLDQQLASSLTQMSDDQLCCVISSDLMALEGMKRSGTSPSSGAFKYTLDEIRAARNVLDARLDSRSRA